MNKSVNTHDQKTGLCDFVCVSLCKVTDDQLSKKRRTQEKKQRQKRKKNIPSIGVVEVREEEDSTDEKSDQH